MSEINKRTGQHRRSGGRQARRAAQAEGIRDKFPIRLSNKDMRPGNGRWK